MCITDYQGRLDSILDNLKNNFHEHKSKFTKLESDLIISTNVNSKISDKLLQVEVSQTNNILGENVWKCQTFLLVSRTII